MPNKYGHGSKQLVPMPNIIYRTTTLLFHRKLYEIQVYILSADFCVLLHDLKIANPKALH